MLAPCSGGSDWQKILLLEVNLDGSTKQLNDTLRNVKFSTTAWAPDSKVSHPRNGPHAATPLFPPPCLQKELHPNMQGGRDAQCRHLCLEQTVMQCGLTG